MPKPALQRKTHNGSPGLWTAPNSELSPPGAYRQALGASIRNAGITEKIRPMRQYCVGQNNFASVGLAGLVPYGSRLLVTTQGGAVYSETGTGTAAFTALTSPLTVTPPDGDKNVVRSAESNGNLLLSTATGILKFDTPGGNPYRAGVARALDVSLTLVASGTLLASGDQVGYRVVFGILDANANLVLGPPSGRVTTTGTAAQDVTVKAYLPTAIYSAANATSYFYQVYRTAKFTVDPGEEMRLVYQAYLTATDVSNKYVSFTDNTPDGLRGTDLYTNPSQEGLAAANYAPPLANDMALFKGTVFYANTTGKHRARLQMLGTPTVYSTSGSFAKASNTVTLTLSGSPDLTGIPTDGTAYISVTGATSAANNGDFPITGWVAATSISYTNAAGVVEAVLAGTKAVATRLTIGGTNYYASLIAENTSAPFRYVVTTAVSSQSTVASATQSLVHVLNATHATVYAYYDSGPDDAAGKILFEEQAIGGSQFTASAAGNVFSTKFSPTIPTTATLKSQNDAAIHRLMYSKPFQPEHVPLANYFDIGSRAKKIVRIIPLREALLVFKEDGLFRVTGDGGVFSVTVFDPTLSIPAVGSALAMGNRAYAFSNRGAVAITESSTQLISGLVRDKFSRFYESIADQTNGYPAFIYMSANEVDHTVTYGMGFNSGDTGCVLQYCATTNAWTELYETDPNIGLVQMYTAGSCMMGGVPFRLLRNAESNDVWRDDMYRREDSRIGGVATGAPSPAHKALLYYTAVNAGAGTMTVDATKCADVASLLVSGAMIGGPAASTKLMTITGVAGSGASTVITVAAHTLTPGATLADLITNSPTGVVYLYVPIEMTMEWVVYTGGDDAEPMRIPEFSILFDPRSTMTTAQVYAYTEATTSTLVGSMTAANSPLPTGIAGQTMFRCTIPANMQKCRRLSVSFVHNTPAEFVFIRGISYVFERTDGHSVT